MLKITVINPKKMVGPLKIKFKYPVMLSIFKTPSNFPKQDVSDNICPNPCKGTKSKCQFPWIIFTIGVGGKFAIPKAESGLYKIRIKNGEKLNYVMTCGSVDEEVVITKF